MTTYTPLIPVDWVPPSECMTCLFLRDVSCLEHIMWGECDCIIEQGIVLSVSLIFEAEVMLCNEHEPDWGDGYIASDGKCYWKDGMVTG